MEHRFTLTCLLVGVLLQRTSTQTTVPDAVLNCCEGDVLILLDSSGSVSSYEYSRLLHFLSKLLLPFALGPSQVRVALLQVGTEPHLDFSFEAHTTQQGLQGALLQAKQLRGDTNTVGALKLAKDQLLAPNGKGSVRPGIPRVLLWLTDGVQPGEVELPLVQLQQEGVAVLAVSTGHGNYQVLKKVVTQPSDKHLYFVDIEDINIITRDLRDAIIEIILAERLQVRDVSSNSAVLQWRPVLSNGSGYYKVWFSPVLADSERPDTSSGTSPSTSSGHHSRLTFDGNTTWAKLVELQPETAYTATLIPHSNLAVMKPLTVTFNTLPVYSPSPEVLSPEVIMVSELGTHSMRVHWGPLQLDSVQKYQVEYSALPRGDVRIVTTGRHENSLVLDQLQPDTQYLVTVCAVHSSGKERAMSIRVCTQEELPALLDLKLTTVGSDSVKVSWNGSAKGLQGYWLNWVGEEGASSGHPSNRFLPPYSFSTVVTNLPSTSRICVSPVYRTARGKGLCCSKHMYSADEAPWDYRLHSSG